MQTMQSKLRDAVETLAENLGIPLSFDADADLAKFRRGRALTMGELRAMPDGAIVWIYIWHKESCRADSAFRMTRENDCFYFDDGSSWSADMANDGDDEDSAPAENEWITVYAAEPK